MLTSLEYLKYRMFFDSWYKTNVSAKFPKESLHENYERSVEIFMKDNSLNIDHWIHMSGMMV